MVLQDWGIKISAALRKMTESSVLDQRAIVVMLVEIGTALRSADVDAALVSKVSSFSPLFVNLIFPDLLSLFLFFRPSLQLTTNIQKKINLQEMAPGLNQRKVIEMVGLCD